MKEKIASAKNWVQTNKRVLVVGAISATVIVIQHKGIKGLNNFLKDQDLFETYYLSEV